MKAIPAVPTFVLLLCIVSVSAEEIDKWALADRQTVRLVPGDFPQLPKRVRDDLYQRGCTIPQADCCSSEPHNVISGHFRNSRQIDWAILCSVNRRSSLLVYGGDSTGTVSALSNTADQYWLQGTGDNNIQFSHRISTVGTKYIVDHARGTIPHSAIVHEGIDDGFDGKASVVRYWYQGEC